MAAGSTYTPIATTTLGSAAASVTFSSISGYTDLVMIFDGLSGSSNNVSLQFNSDTSSNYSSTRVRGTGTAAESSRWTNITQMYGSNTDTSGRSSVIWNIQNYANSTTYKTAICKGGGSGGEASAYVGLWRNTAAITSVTVIISATTFNTGSTFTLYGIAAA